MCNEIDCDESEILFQRGMEYFWFHNWLDKFNFESLIADELRKINEWVYL